MKLIIYPDRDLLEIGLADRLVSTLSGALKARAQVTLAVAGGTTPGPVFDLLSQADLDWSRVTVLASDERFVPPGHARSNAALIAGRLLCGKARAARHLIWVQQDATPEEAAVRLSAQIAPLLPIDVLLLGMGADLHTASLFPGSDGLGAALSPNAPPVVAIHTPAQPEPRLTLSAPVLQGALASFVMMTGTEKRAALAKAEGLGPEQAPIALMRDEAEFHWAE